MMSIRLSVTLFVLVLLATSQVFFGIANAQEGDSGASEEINLLNKEIQEKRSGIDQLNKQIQKFEQKILDKQGQAKSLSVEISILENRMTKTELSIEVAEEEIDLVNIEIRTLEKELGAFEKKIEYQKGVVADVLRVIQVQDNSFPLKALFSSESLAQLFDDLKYLETISSDLKDAIDGLKASKDKVQGSKEKEQAKRGQLEDLSLALEKKKDLLSQESDAKEHLILVTRESEIEFQSLLRELEQEQTFINQQIFGLQQRLEGKLSETDALGDSSVLSWPTSPSNRRITAVFHDPTYPFRHLFEHSGLDIGAPTGTPVLSAAPGYVAWTRKGRLYGNYVMIIHTNGTATLYAHLSRTDVVPDQFVSRSEQIGAIGNTGFSTGPHLHFEVRKNGIPTNPLDYLISY